jgi:hypothetical protein
VRRVFIAVSVFLFSVGYLVSLALSYWQIPVTELLSFRVDDGWCDPSVSGFGQHCFGDYQVPLNNIQSGNFWELNAYPPFALLPFFIAKFLTVYFSDQLVLALYLFLLLFSMLSAAIYVIIKGRYKSTYVVALLVIGVAAHPIVMALDRGSSVGFVVPALLFFAVFIKDDSPAVIFPAALAVAWRPQYALLLLIFVGLGRIRRMILTVALTTFIYMSSLLLIPGRVLFNFRNWMDGMSKHGDVGMLFEDGSAKVSAARGVFHASKFLGKLHPPLGELGSTYLRNSYGVWFSPGYLLAGLTVFVFIRCNEFKDVYIKTVVVLALSALVFPITFGYYNIFAIIIGSIIMLEKRSEFDPALNLPSRKFRSVFDLISQKWWELLVVTATAITLAPIPVPTKISGQTLNIEYSGLIWTIVVLLGLTKISVNSINAKRAD